MELYFGFIGILTLMVLAEAAVVVVTILVLLIAKRVVQAILEGLRAIVDWAIYQVFERRKTEELFEPWCVCEDEDYSREYYEVNAE